MARRMPAAAALLVAAAMGTTTGCSSGPASTGTPRVATLASAAVPSSVPSPAAPERPRERLDSTPEDRELMIKPYDDCLARHARDVVACLRRKGVKYVEVNPDGRGFAFGGEQNHAQSISRGLDLTPDCEREVAAGQ